MNNVTPETPKEKMAAYRARMRDQGLRLAQIWVPDTRSEEYKKEARRQSSLLANDPQEEEILELIEETMDTTGWKA